MEKILTIAAKGVGTTVLLVVFGTLGALISGLPVMLALGVLHNDVNANVPALGYWVTVIAMWGLSVLVASLRPTPRA